MFAKLKAKLGGGVNRFSGNTDFLEAVCASCSLVAAADGEISDEECLQAIKVVSSNESLSKAFPPQVIEKTMDKMMERVTAGRTGRANVMKEISDIADNTEMAETVYLTALDVAEANGDVCEAERDMLNKIASRLGVNPSSLEV